MCLYVNKTFHWNRAVLPSNSHNCASIYSASVCEMHKIYYTINGDKSTFLRSLDSLVIECARAADQYRCLWPFHLRSPSKRDPYWITLCAMFNRYTGQNGTEYIRKFRIRFVCGNQECGHEWRKYTHDSPLFADICPKCSKFTNAWRIVSRFSGLTCPFTFN